MKRGRKTSVSCTRKHGKEFGEAEEKQSSNFGYRCITELPKCISIDILLRLSVNRLLVCKCVCKTWRYLISDPEFAKQHFTKGEVCPLIRSFSREDISRTLYLVEPHEYRFAGDFDHQDCICYKNCLLCEVHCKKKLDTKLKIPLRNSDLALDTQREEDANIQSNGAKDLRFEVVNSCHGLLCLSKPSKNDPIAVCNPITGEYINLPIPTQDKDKYNPWVDCALGFSPQANQYKVIRMFRQEKRQSFHDPTTRKSTRRCRETDIHILGTSSWRRIGHAPFYYGKLEYPTFLNGSLHWLYPTCVKSNYIISFDFDNDEFQPIPPPPEVDDCCRRAMTLSVLRGCLCICYFDVEVLLVWALEHYGAQRSWTKKHCLTARFSAPWCLWGLNEPISVLSNGGVLSFHRRTSSLLFYHPNGRDINYLKLHGRGEKSEFEAIPYIPSFISLKDVVAGKELQVININSRCAGLKLLEESQTLYSQEADAEIDIAAWSFGRGELLMKNPCSCKVGHMLLCAPYLVFEIGVHCSSIKCKTSLMFFIHRGAFT